MIPSHFHSSHPNQSDYDDSHGHTQSHTHPWGDIIADKTNTTFRIHHLNHNGFRISNSVDTNYLLSSLLHIRDEQQPSLYSCNEINTNIDLPKVRNAIRQTIKTVFPFSAYRMTHTPDDFHSRIHKPGGNAIIITDHWVNRIIKNGSDPYGRWTHFSIQGKQNQIITFISAYRTPEFTYQPGSLTVHQQEYLKRLPLYHQAT